jgi:hypothetical protein
MTSSKSLNVSTVSGRLYKHTNIQEISDFISGTAKYVCSINSFSQMTYITDIKSSSAGYGTGGHGIGSIHPTPQSINFAFRTC